MSGLFAVPFFRKNSSLKPHSFSIYKALHLFFTRLIGRTDMVCLYCQPYDRRKLDITIPDSVTRFRERCVDLEDLIIDLRVDVAYLQELCDHYEQILKEHGLL